MRSLFFASVAVAFFLFSCQDNPKSAPRMTGLAGNLQDSSIIRIWPKEMDSLLKVNPNIPVIDVRSESEFRISHIYRSMNCDVSSPYFSKRIMRLGIETPVIVYDVNSTLSLQAAQQMKQLGFKRIYEIAGGLYSLAREGKTLVTGESKIDSSTILK